MLVSFVIFLIAFPNAPDWKDHYSLTYELTLLIFVVGVGIFLTPLYLAISFASIIVYYKMRIKGIELHKKDRIFWVVNLVTIIVFGLIEIIFNPNFFLGSPTGIILIPEMLTVIVLAFGFASIIVMCKIKPGDERVFWPLILNWGALLFTIIILAILGFGNLIAMFLFMPFTWIVSAGLVPAMLVNIVVYLPLILFFAGTSQFFTAKYRPDKLPITTALNSITLLSLIFVQLFSLHILGASVILLAIIAATATVLVVILARFFHGRQIQDLTPWQVLSISLVILFTGAFGFSFYILAKYAPTIVSWPGLGVSSSIIEPKSQKNTTTNNSVDDEQEAIEDFDEEVEGSDTDDFENEFEEDNDNYEDYEGDEYDEYDEDYGDYDDEEDFDYEDYEDEEDF